MMVSGKLKRLIDFSSWSALDKASVQKSDIFLSQFALLAIIGAGVSAVHDSFFESLETVIIDIVIVGIFILTYLLNEKGYHLKAKLIFVFVSPTSMFIYASLLPKESGVYFIFFPIIMMIFLLFDRKHRVYQLLALFYSLLLLIILEVTDYQPFGFPPLLEEVASSTSYYINLVISFFVTIFSLFSIESLNNQIENRRQEALITLNERNEELKEINNELDQFVYSASHDLKAPLLSVLGLINIAKYDVKEEVSLLYFQKIEKRVIRLNGFIKEVLSISRNARTEVITEDFDLKELIDELIEQNSYIDVVNKVKVNFNMKFNKTIRTDRYRLEIVLNNLISNALKYQDMDKEDHYLNISSSLESDLLILKIVDNGVGISNKDQLKVFDMFFRANEKSEGSGLGLYIVQSALKKLNAKIVLNSKLGAGTEVTLSIPVIH